jgi:hypothetical protein
VTGAGTVVSASGGVALGAPPTVEAVLAGQAALGLASAVGVTAIAAVVGILDGVAARLAQVTAVAAAASRAVIAGAALPVVVPTVDLALVSLPSEPAGPAPRPAGAGAGRARPWWRRRPGHFVHAAAGDAARPTSGLVAEQPSRSGARTGLRQTGRSHPSSPGVSSLVPSRPAADERIVVAGLAASTDGAAARSEMGAGSSAIPGTVDSPPPASALWVQTACSRSSCCSGRRD